MNKMITPVNIDYENLKLQYILTFNISIQINVLLTLIKAPNSQESNTTIIKEDVFCVQSFWSDPNSETELETRKDSAKSS